MSTYREDRLRALVRSLEHDQRKYDYLDEEIKDKERELARLKALRSNFASSIAERQAERDYLEGDSE